MAPGPITYRATYRRLAEKDSRLPAVHFSPTRIRTRRWPLALLIAPLLVAAAIACGSSSDSSAEVRDIAEILATEVEVTELTASGAVVRLETTIDVVCSVVYGVDESYGSQATDLDMAGGGHSVHGPRLQGLEPDTEYHFRLQGTAPDGTLFVSEDMTFRTPPASAAAPETRTNLASLEEGASVIDASSFFGGMEAWRPENALDGNPNTEWSSAGDGDDAFIEIQLAEPSEVAAVALWTRTMGSSAEIGSFRVITDDGTEYGPFDLPDSTQIYEFPLSATTQTLRFEVVSSSGGNTGIVEIAAYAAE